MLLRHLFPLVIEAHWTTYILEDPFHLAHQHKRINRRINSLLFNFLSAPTLKRAEPTNCDQHGDRKSNDGQNLRPTKLPRISHQFPRRRLCLRPPAQSFAVPPIHPTFRPVNNRPNRQTNHDASFRGLCGTLPNQEASMNWPDIPAPALTVISSFVGAWLAAQFALSRFYREKVWERKTAAYTAIFEALHDMDRWFDEHIDELAHNRELSTERAAQLRTDSLAADQLLDRRLAAETWLIPDPIRERIQDGLLELRRASYTTDWAEHLVNGSRALQSLTSDLRRSVRRDLHLRNRLLFMARIRKRIARNNRKRRFRTNPPTSSIPITDSTPGTKNQG
jgi:hypothetical protein